jgi:hypothetical protein
MPRGFREALMSVGTVAVLVLVLVAVDDRVRERLSEQVTAHPSVEVASMGRQVRDFTSVIAQSARHQSIGHVSMLMFTLAAAVLVLFMLRT